MINENEEVKLYWSWKTYVKEISQKSSDLSRDLYNLETPTHTNI